MEGPLLPVDEFRLLAVSTRYPEKLAGQVQLTPVKPGVLEVHWGVRRIQLIVLRDVPPEPRNALWALFRAGAEIDSHFGTSDDVHF